MKSIGPRYILLACALSNAFLAGCSDRPNAPEIASIDTDAPEFSEADKRAARALSIGDEQGLAKMDNPNAQARACSQAIGLMADKLREANALTEEQFSALEKARAFYANKSPPSSTEKFQTGMSASGSPEATARPEENLAQSGRTAIACIRRLQES